MLSDLVYAMGMGYRWLAWTAVTLLISPFVAMPLHAAPSAWLQTEIRNMHLITGRFVQQDYGFSVEAPSEVSEYVTNGGDANHGLTIILGEHREIVVYPAYIGPDLGGTIKHCGSNQFPGEKTRSRTKGTIPLGGRIACRINFTKRDTVWSVTQASGEDRGQGIMYTLLLKTTRQFQKADLASFRRVAASFKRVPIDP